MLTNRVMLEGLPVPAVGSDVVVVSPAHIDPQAARDRKNDLHETVPLLRSFLPVGSDIGRCGCHDAVVSIVQRNGRLEKAASFIV